MCIIISSCLIMFLADYLCILFCFFALSLICSHCIIWLSFYLYCFILSVVFCACMRNSNRKFFMKKQITKNTKICSEHNFMNNIILTISKTSNKSICHVCFCIFRTLSLRLSCYFSGEWSLDVVWIFNLHSLFLLLLKWCRAPWRWCTRRSPP